MRRAVESLRPDRGSRLPFALALLLAVMAVLQLLLAGQVEPLPAGAVAQPRIARYAEPRVAAVIAPTVIVQRALFAPPRVAAAVSLGAAGVAAPPLGGAVVAGSVAIRGRRYAVVRQPSGAVANVPVGGRIAGWRLAALDESGALFRRGAERLRVDYGAAPDAENNDNEEAAQ